MKSKQEILDELHKTEFIENYTRKVIKQKNLLEDASQEVWSIVAAVPEERLKGLYREDGINGVRRYVSGVINRTINSDTSSFYIKYIKRSVENLTKKIDNDHKVKFSEVTGWDIPDGKRIAMKDDFQTLDIEYMTNITNSEIINKLNSLDPQDRNLFIDYIKNQCHYTKTAKAYKVSVPLIKREIHRIRELLKKDYFK